jgi:hypothetical protein
MGRVVFILKVIGISILGTGFLVCLSIILAERYGISNAPVILLSSINAIAVISLAFFTYSYMKSTKLMADEMKSSNDMAFELSHRPKVVAWFDAKSNGAIYIVVENQGNGAAKNIKLDIKPELRNSYGETIEKWPALKNGISYLAPEKKVTFFFDMAFTLFGKPDLPKDFKVKIEYDWAIEGRPKISEESPLELSPFLGTDLASYKDITTLIDEVEKIRKVLEKHK